MSKEVKIEKKPGFDFNKAKKENPFESEPYKPTWKPFEKESIKASIEAGEILPELYPRKDATYRAELLKLPEEVKSTKGDFFVVVLNHNGMEKTMKVNRSFMFFMDRYVEKYKVPYENLLKKELVFQKDEKGYFSVQIK